MMPRDYRELVRLDYWMIEILLDALRALEKEKCFDRKGRALYSENENRFNIWGAIRLTEERIRKMREEFDYNIRLDLKEIKRRS